MARPGEPSQASVLRDRSARVPWRQVIREAIRDRMGNGRAALPDRLEGAVYGQLVGEALGSEAAPSSVPGPASPADGVAPGAGSAGAGDAARSRLLALLDALLSGRAEPGDGGPAAGGARPESARTGRIETMAGRSPAGILPVALVMRGCAPAEVVAATVDASRASGDAQVACALYALVVQRLVAGERGRERALGRATGDLRAALASRETAGSAPTDPTTATTATTPTLAPFAALDALVARPGRTGEDPSVDGFRCGWQAFAGSAGFEESVRRALAHASDGPSAGGIAGGLAGAYWGSSGIPPDRRRALPDAQGIRPLVDRLIETDAPAWDGRAWRTSTSSPLRVDPVDLTGCDGCTRGTVGMTFLPGRRYVGYHTGAHWRDLETDSTRLRELGVDVLFLLVEDRELARCRVTGIGEALAAHGVDLVRFPIRDPLLPRDGVAFRGTVASLLWRVRAGGSVAIACRAGLDRAGMAAGCLLREAGLGPDEAIRRVQQARRGALTLPDQQAYVREWPPQR